MNKKHYSEEEINFLKENVSKFGVQICADKLDRTINGIINKCRRLGIKLNDKCNASVEEINNLKFNFNNLILNFSETLFPKELAYFLGFLWADGYVKVPNRIIIEIAEEDGIKLQPIFEKLTKFSIYKRCREGRKPQMTFYYSDSNITNLLYNLGKYPHSSESHEKILTYIPEKYHIWFIRGLIDGDGNFYIQDKKSSTIAQFSISSNLNQDWDYLSKILSKYRLNCSIMKTESTHGNSSVLRCANTKNIQSFIELLYKDKDDIWLPRKYEKAQLILNIKTHG